MLAAIRIVLVRPTHPGNIGAAARALKNMGLSRLDLVAPENYPDPEASARAVDAKDVLEGAIIFPTLDEALKDCKTVIGTSSRQRRIEWPTLDPSACARRMLADAEHGAVALLFGQERTGLTNVELDRCQAVVEIPANPAYPSLNIAGAVQILAYEIWRAHSDRRANIAARSGESPASREDMQRLYRHLQEVLVQLQFLDPENPRLLMRRLIRLFNRAAPTHNEMNILRGILTAVQQRAKLDSQRKE